MDKQVKIFKRVKQLSSLSVQDFEANYLNAEKPVIIINSIDDWPAKNWSLSLLKEKAGHNDVFVRRNTSDETYKTGKKYNIESMRFAEYIENIEKNNKKANSSYLAVQNIRKALPELEADLKIPDYIKKLHGGPFLWLARKNHYEFCHFDPDDNFLIVLSGRKYVRLYKAADIEKLYPNHLGSMGRTIQSQVNCNKPDLEKFPMFANVGCYECVVNAGEMLYFPAFWWHQVTSTETTISINIFFGNDGDNIYLTKIMTGNQWEAFKHWLLNIIEQNRTRLQFQKVLQYLTESLEGFILKQWHEIPSEEQIQTLVKVVLDYCGLEKIPERKENLKHPPPLKIRGLLWR